MPTDYELWLTQHDLQDVAQAQVLEFQHPAWGSLWATDYGSEITARTAPDGAEFVALPVPFTLDRPQSGESTRQELTIKMDALGGRVLGYIRDLTEEQRRTLVRVVYRIYLDSDWSQPVLDPLVFELRDLAATRLVTELHCSVTILPNQIAGTRYTLDNFPTLAYI